MHLDFGGKHSTFSGSFKGKKTINGYRICKVVSISFQFQRQTTNLKVATKSCHESLEMTTCLYISVIK